MSLFETKMSLGWMAEKFPTLNGTKNLTTVPTRERLGIITPAKRIQSISHPTVVKTLYNMGCPTRYRNRHFFNNFTTGCRTAAPCRNN